MAIKFQYNKTSLNELNKQLKVRTRALPTLKNKESALRLEVKKAKQRSDALLEQLAASLKEFEYLAGLWNEFEPGLISIQDEFDYFRKPLWYSEGVKILKDLALLGIESEICTEKSKILDYSRKKTTQKVNLYEKVQIPGYQEAILKIKRFMEDEENLSKASQKIVKTRHDLEEEEAL